MVRTTFVACALVVAITPAISAQAPPTDETRFFAGEISAGTIVVGEVRVDEISGDADLAGSGFHIVGSMAPGPYFAPCNETPSCVSGYEVDLGFISFGFFSGFTIHGGRVTVNGETLQPANVRLGWPLLDADPVTIPRGHRKNLVLSAPFVLTDGVTSSQVLEVRVHHPDDIFEEHPWAIGQISGAGIVTGFFERQTYKPPREHNEPGPRTSFYYVLSKLIYSFNKP